MEVTSHKQGGSIKSKLVTSFYRTAKSPSATQYATAAVVRASALVKTVSLKNHEGKFCGSDGYIHGQNNRGGDEHVDNKATCYISHVKERLKLEESDLILKEKNHVVNY
ncbi:hypothetical protein F511_25477 [Dorcoceras hygrometricum]|uniref:Uncharacterized protein n=1 Tax=Dorcoceras hygrometricum TaxID=472368 RepID=A0A2Z7AYZ8_9LAMI|nr:hypothetical protein F511_25477 [Dorcoceras hygrometricum]